MSTTFPAVDRTVDPSVDFAAVTEAIASGRVPVAPTFAVDLYRDIHKGIRAELFAITMAVLAIVLIAVTVETNGKGAPVETKITPLATLAIAWFFSNMVFALHYAHMYYRNSNGQDAGGLELPDGEPPTYIDFCYFSFVIGMTFQVSDIDITSRDIRAASLVHSLIAFFFNVGVIALSVNIVAGN